MDVIISWFESLFNSISMINKLFHWMLAGLVNLGTVMWESINIFGEILEFLPVVITTTMIGVCAVLVALRILGRS